MRLILNFERVVGSGKTSMPRRRETCDFSHSGGQDLKNRTVRRRPHTSAARSGFHATLEGPRTPGRCWVVPRAAISCAARRRCRDAAKRAIFRTPTVTVRTSKIKRFGAARARPQLSQASTQRLKVPASPCDAVWCRAWRFSAPHDVDAATQRNVRFFALRRSGPQKSHGSAPSARVRSSLRLRGNA